VEAVRPISDSVCSGGVALGGAGALLLLASAVMSRADL
jgi:hypothetical protein